jgi:hypothetical protein
MFHARSESNLTKQAASNSVFENVNKILSTFVPAYQGGEINQV